MIFSTEASATTVSAPFGSANSNQSGPDDRTGPADAASGSKCSSTLEASTASNPGAPPAPGVSLSVRNPVLRSSTTGCTSDAV